MTTSQLNKNFRIVRQKYNTPTRERHLVGAGQLHKYIGEKNAKTCFEKVVKSMEDKTEFKFRKEGIVIFYVK